MKYWFIALFGGMMIITGAFFLLLVGLFPLTISNNEALLLGFGLILAGWALSVWFSPVGRSKKGE